MTIGIIRFNIQKFFDIGENSNKIPEKDPVSEADIFIQRSEYQSAENILIQARSIHPERVDILLKLLELYTIWGEKKDILGLTNKIYAHKSVTLEDRRKCADLHAKIDAKSKVILEPTLEPTHEVIPEPTLDDPISGSSAEVMETTLESENIVSETFVPADWADSDDDLPQEEAMEILRQLQEAGIQDIPDDVPGILRTK